MTGRFADMDTQLVHEISFAGFGESVGSAELGTYTKIDLPTSIEGYREFLNDVVPDSVSNLLNYRVGILFEDPQGFVYCHLFADDDEAKLFWTLAYRKINGEDLGDIFGINTKGDPHYGRIRKASLIEGRRLVVIKKFLPDNYDVLDVDDEYIYIGGYDQAGWTWDDYIVPRLASGLIFVERIEYDALPS